MSAPTDVSSVRLGRVHQVQDLPSLLGNPAGIDEMHHRIRGGDIYIVKRAYDRACLEPIREYLATVGRSTLPNYQPIVPGAPNSHRVNRFDDRAYVKGCFHQFQFLPWNQDVFGLFDMFRPVYQLKNLLGGLPANSFLDNQPENGVTARLSFQYYPRGIGQLNMHADPVDRHQMTVPTMLLSQKGEDYSSGGLVVIGRDGKKVDVDAQMGWGDVLFFRADLAHGVEVIDPESTAPWTSFQGRWMVIFAVNKLQQTDDVADAVDLEQL